MNTARVKVKVAGRRREWEMVRLCRTCRTEVEENDGVIGRYYLRKCRCGHHQGIEFVRYKPRAPPTPQTKEQRAVRRALRKGIQPLGRFEVVS